MQLHVITPGHPVDGGVFNVSNRFEWSRVQWIILCHYFIFEQSYGRFGHSVIVRVADGSDGCEDPLEHEIFGEAECCDDQLNSP